MSEGAGLSDAGFSSAQVAQNPTPGTAPSGTYHRVIQLHLFRRIKHACTSTGGPGNRTVAYPSHDESPPRAECSARSPATEQARVLPLRERTRNRSGQPKKRIQNTRLMRVMPLCLEHDRFHLRVGCDLVDKALVVAGEDHRLACAQAVRDDVVRLGAAGGVE